jgi:hypothetical protein
VSRLFWMAVGAAGGIYVYRNGARLAADARDRGVLAVAQDIAGSASATVATVRGLLGQQGLSAPTDASRVTPTWPGNGSAR